MAEGSAKVVVLSALLAAGAGVGTALFMIPRMGLPGGPVLVKAELDLAAENRKLKEQVAALQREVSEAKLQLAALRAFPRGREGGRPGDDPETERVLRDAQELSLRGALDRASAATPIEKERRESVLALLLEASGRMRKIRDRLAAGGDATASAEAEDLGRETRRKLAEALSPEQLAAVDRALGAPEPEAGEKR